MKAYTVNKVAKNPVFWILFISEGFRQSDKNVFYNHCKMLKNNLLKIYPFNTLKDRIAIYAYFKESQKTRIDNVEKNTAYKFFISGGENLVTNQPGIITDDINELIVRYNNKSVFAKSIWMNNEINNNRLTFVICNTSQKISTFQNNLNTTSISYPSINHTPHNRLLKNTQRIFPLAAVSLFPVTYPSTNLSTTQIRDRKNQAGAIIAKMIGLAIGLRFESQVKNDDLKIKEIGSFPFSQNLIDTLNSGTTIPSSSILFKKFKSVLNIDLTVDSNTKKYKSYIVKQQEIWVVKSDKNLEQYPVTLKNNSITVFLDTNQAPNIQSYWSLFESSAFSLESLKWKDLIPANRRAKQTTFKLSPPIDFSKLDKKINTSVVTIKDKSEDTRFYSKKGKNLINLKAPNIIQQYNNLYKSGLECLMRFEGFNYKDSQGVDRSKVIPFCNVCIKSLQNKLTGNSVLNTINSFSVIKDTSPRNSNGDFDKIDSWVADEFYKFIEADNTRYKASKGYNCVQTTLYRFQSFFDKKLKYKKITIIKKGSDFPYQVKFPKIKRDVTGYRALVLWVSSIGGLAKTPIKNFAALGAAGTLEYLGLGRVKNHKYDYGDFDVNLKGNGNTVLGYTIDDIKNNPNHFQKGSLIQLWYRASNEKDIHGNPISESYLNVYRKANKIATTTNDVGGHSLVYMGVKNGIVYVADQFGNNLELENDWGSYNFIILGEWFDAKP